MLESEVRDAFLSPLKLRMPGHWHELREPTPVDPVIEALLRAPLVRARSARGWAASLKMPERVFLEAFETEAGLPFGAWQKRVRILRGLVLLAGGKRVADVASALHYSSDSAFIHAFRQALGTTPKRYFSLPEHPRRQGAG